MNAKDRILRHMKEFGTITTLEAVKEYGCLMLPHYIWILRHIDNIDIKDEWVYSKNRYGEKTKYKKYWMEVEE